MKIEKLLIQQGYDDFNAGFNKSDCPYEDGTDDKNGWMKGWLLALNVFNNEENPNYMQISVTDVRDYNSREYFSGKSNLLRITINGRKYEIRPSGLSGIRIIPLTNEEGYSPPIVLPSDREVTVTTHEDLKKRI